VFTSSLRVLLIPRFDREKLGEKICIVKGDKKETMNGFPFAYLRHLSLATAIK